MGNAMPWRPTGGKNGLLEKRLNLGHWNGNPIYIHFTSHAGLTSISSAGVINATPKQERRGGAAKNGVYLNPAKQTFGTADAWTLLFFENETYRNSAERCIVFSFLTQPADSFFKTGPISSSSWVEEIVYLKSITFKEIDILYRGPNPFVERRHQSC